MKSSLLYSGMGTAMGKKQVNRWTKLTISENHENHEENKLGELVERDHLVVTEDH